MKISKTHQRFSKRLNQPDALTNPGKYLGPNWEDVLNFWIYVDTLGYQERKEISDLYLALECDELWSAIISARHAAAVVVGEEFIDSAWLTAYNATGCAVFSDATCELIGSHKLLE